MLAEVKRCADQGDIMGLRYIFVDSLDVDPTFESYLEEYEYCKHVDGLFDAHRELSPLLSDQTRWTLTYWDQLKIDLMNNFSQRRFEHMMVVARIVHADKVARMMAEQHHREQRRRAIEENNRRADEKQHADGKQAEEARAAKESAPLNTPPLEQSTLSKSEKQRQNIEQKRRALEEKNRKTEENLREQKKQVDKSKEKYGSNQSAQKSGTGSKKAPGLALAVLAAIAVLLVIAMLLGRSPR